MGAREEGARCERCGGEPVAVRVAGRSLCAACARKEVEDRADEQAEDADGASD